MIVSEVKGGKEEQISVQLLGADGEIRVDAVVDTGFDGYLALPHALVRKCALRFHSRTIVALGDASLTVLRQYEAVIKWGTQDRNVLVLLAEGPPLVGMALLYNHDVSIRVIERGRVMIRPIMSAE